MASVESSGFQISYTDHNTGAGVMKLANHNITSETILFLQSMIS